MTRPPRLWRRTGFATSLVGYLLVDFGSLGVTSTGATPAGAAALAVGAALLALGVWALRGAGRAPTPC